VTPPPAIIVRQSVGIAVEICAACGQLHADFVELHLRHSGQKLILCSKCDESQLQKPRMVRVSYA
jgi:hypothetical protein